MCCVLCERVCVCCASCEGLHIMLLAEDIVMVTIGSSSTTLKEI